MIEQQARPPSVEIDLVWGLGGAHEVERRVLTGDERAVRTMDAIEHVWLDLIDPTGATCAGCAKRLHKVNQIACIGPAHFYANPEKAVGVAICQHCGAQRDEVEQHVRAALLALPRANGSSGHPIVRGRPPRSTA